MEEIAPSIHLLNETLVLGKDEEAAVAMGSRSSKEVGEDVETAVIGLIGGLLTVVLALSG